LSLDIHTAKATARPNHHLVDRNGEAIHDDLQAVHRRPDLADLDEAHCLACELVPADLRQAQLKASTRLSEHSSFDVDTAHITGSLERFFVVRPCRFVVPSPGEDRSQTLKEP
jgi:hypothetical protein